MEDESTEVFCVVKLQDILSAGAKEYKCVPRTWIRKLVAGPTILVAYPEEEDSEDIANKVKNQERSLDTWPFFSCEIIESTKEYEGAKAIADHYNKNTQNKKPNDGVHSIETEGFVARSGRKRSHSGHSETTPTNAAMTNYPSPQIPPPYYVRDNLYNPSGKSAHKTAVPNLFQSPFKVTTEITLPSFPYPYTSEYQPCDNTFLSSVPYVDSRIINEIARNYSRSMQDKMNENTTPEANKKQNGTEVKLTPPTVKTGEKDTKWTLRYPEFKEGLVELIENSKVYVEKQRLEEFKTNAKDCKTLAHYVLREVFKIEALSVCALNKVNSSHPERARYLDVNAKNVVIKFVEQFGREKGWEVDTSAIVDSMRYRLHCYKKNETLRLKQDKDTARGQVSQTRSVEVVQTQPLLDAN